MQSKSTRRVLDGSSASQLLTEAWYIKILMLATVTNPSCNGNDYFNSNGVHCEDSFLSLRYLLGLFALCHNDSWL